MPLSEACADPVAVATAAEELPDSDSLQRDWHRAMLIVALTIIALSFVLMVRDDQRVAFVGFAAAALPESCGMRIFFQRDCPACGLTRSFIYLAHGDVSSSIGVHRFGWLLAAAVLLQLPYRWLALRNPALSLSSRTAIWIAGLFVALFLANWIYEQLAGISYRT